MHDAAGSPVAAQFDGQLLLPEADAGIVRDLQPPEHAIDPQPVLAAVEGDGAADHLVMMAAGVDHHRTDGNVFARTFEYHGGVGERGAAPPFPQRPRVAAVGQRAGAEIGADEDPVAVRPGDVGFRFRKLEAIGEEASADDVELANHHGIATTARQPQQAAIIPGPDDIGTVPHPVLVLADGQRIEIEHGFPGRFRLAVLGKRGPPPDAPHLLRIAPEVVEVRTDLGDVRNARVRIEDGQQALVDRLVDRAGFQFLRRGLVARPDPVQRPGATDIFQPQIGIVGSRCAVIQPGQGHHHSVQPSRNGIRCRSGGTASPVVHRNRAARAAARWPAGRLEPGLCPASFAALSGASLSGGSC